MTCRLIIGALDARQFHNSMEFHLKKTWNLELEFHGIPWNYGMESTPNFICSAGTRYSTVRHVRSTFVLECPTEDTHELAATVVRTRM